MLPVEKVKKRFQDIFQEEARILVRAPGRVNIIGEHTDYNDGFVLPMAIDRGISVALRKRKDDRVIIHSLEFDDVCDFCLGDFGKEKGWAEYVKGVAWALKKNGYSINGWEGTLIGDIPKGAGLSSSAALEMAIITAFTAVSDCELEPGLMAQFGQLAENEWVGVNCGIMDQMISATGQAGHALLIDCRSLETFKVPIPSGATVIVLDTSTRRGLVDSEYNTRREQCQKGADFFNLKSLRDLSIQRFEQEKSKLDGIISRRVKHIVWENMRTLSAAETMKDNNSAALGKLMYESHISLRDNFEVSSDALNAIVECSIKIEGCYGARMTGAGFGGCGVALVENSKIENFAKEVEKDFHQGTGLQASIYVCEAANGAEVFLNE